MEKIIANHLTELKISISKNYCEELILSHPEYPSVLSIADCFNNLGIKYDSFRVEKTDELNNIERPFLAHSNRDEMKNVFGGQMQYSGGCGKCKNPQGGGSTGCYKQSGGPTNGECRCMYQAETCS